MKARDVLLRAGGLYKQGAGVLLAITAVLSVPATGVLMLVEALIARASAEGEAPFSLTLGKGAISLVHTFAWTMTTIVLTVAASDLAEGKAPVWRSVWRRGLGRVGPVLTATIVFMLPVMGLLMLGMVMIILSAIFSRAGQGDTGSADRLWFFGPFVLVLVTAGLLMVVRYGLVTPVAVLEEKGGRAAVRRAVALVRGHKLLMLWSAGIPCAAGVSVGLLVGAAVGGGMPVLAPLFAMLVSSTIAPLTASIGVVLYRGLVAESGALPAGDGPPAI